MLETLAAGIADSALRGWVVETLSNVPGLPPLLQSLHIFGIAMLVSAVVMPELRVLGLAAHRQSLDEMLHRLRPWAMSALALLALTGSVFVVARPYRYLFNPVAGIKLATLLLALGLTWVGLRRARRSAPVFTPGQKTLAAVAVLAWVGVIFAGRWIAYVDYLFWEA